MHIETFNFLSIEFLKIKPACHISQEGGELAVTMHYNELNKKLWGFYISIYKNVIVIKSRQQQQQCIPPLHQYNDSGQIQQTYLLINIWLTCNNVADLTIIQMWINPQVLPWQYIRYIKSYFENFS